jgi:hypothetical protein
LPIPTHGPPQPVTKPQSAINAAQADLSISTTFTLHRGPEAARPPSENGRLSARTGAIVPGSRTPNSQGTRKDAGKDGLRLALFCKLRRDRLPKINRLRDRARRAFLNSDATSLSALTSPCWLCKCFAAFETALKHDIICFSRIFPTLRETKRYR